MYRLAAVETLAARSSGASDLRIIIGESGSGKSVTAQALMLSLLQDLQREFDQSDRFFSHSMSVIRYISDSILVMYAGKIVEFGTRDEIPRQPLHPAIGHAPKT